MILVFIISGRRLDQVVGAVAARLLPSRFAELSFVRCQVVSMKFRLSSAQVGLRPPVKARRTVTGEESGWLPSCVGMITLVHDTIHTYTKISESEE